MPTGSVTFTNGSTTLGTVTLSGGTASYSTAKLATGLDTITATYNGSTNFTTSSASVNQAVNQDGTSTVLSSSVNPSVYGQSVTFTATVSAAAPGSGTPTGSVTFMDGSTALGSATLSSGKASFKTSSMAVGSQSITADYSGDGNFTTSTSTSLAQTIQQDATTTSLKSSANPSVFGQSVTFTATVKAASPGSGTPSGTVTFYNGSTTLDTATLGGTGTASFTTSSLSVGSHSIKVSYGGDADFKASTSAVLKQVVQASSSSSAAQLVDQALGALPDDDAPTVGSTVHDLALEQVSVRDRRPHSHWRLS